MDGPGAPRYRRGVITRLEIENFKAIRKVAIDLEPLTVLVGPNDSGKTTILQALAALSRSLIDPVYDYDDERTVGRTVFPRWPVEYLPGHDATLITRLGVSGQASLAAGRRTEPYEYRVSFGHVPGVAWGVVDESLRWNGQELLRAAVAGTDHASLADQKAPGWNGSRTIVSMVRNEPHAAAIHQELGSFAVSLDARAMVTPTLPNARLQGDGAGLSALIDRMLTAPDRRPLRAFEEALRRMSPFAQGVATKPVGIADGRGGSTSAKEWLFSVGGKGVAASEVSAGLVLTAGYLALLHGTPHRMFLIEEPENGLHPHAILSVVDILREIVDSGRQVLATTHSPLLVNHLDPGAIRIVTRDAEHGVRVTKMTETEHFDERMRDFSLGDLWYNVGEDELVPSAS